MVWCLVKQRDSFTFTVRQHDWNVSPMARTSLWFYVFIYSMYIYVSPCGDRGIKIVPL
jgi:hypothetical protein